ncbi:MAG: MOSC domain-containing protein [Actinobacteria bacterium]|uniref:Unannotated protein n=1 Tax=freshwater metagenome TaxID=449393 RepID=A0A6J5ZAB6_9ZZZZ|nr:MOSC domain-containing protein [Actinomycetota bacterium]
MSVHESNSLGGSQPSVVSLNVVFAEIPDVGGAIGRTAIDKRAVSESLAVTTDGIQGDFRSDIKHHGSPDQAVYAYSHEDYEWWSVQLQMPLAPGVFGENLTTIGIDWTTAVVGSVLTIGTSQLQVSAPRIPCGTFARWMDQDHWVKRFTDSGRCGSYLRVLEPGQIAPGQDIEFLDIPQHGVTILDLFRVYNGDREQHRLLRVAQCEDASESFRTKAQVALK